MKIRFRYQYQQGRGQRRWPDTIQRACEFATRASGALVILARLEREETRYPYNYGFDMRLTSDGTLHRRRTQWDRDRFAATYEQWGHVLNYLFSVQPTAKLGPYRGRDDFDRQTNNRFPAIQVRDDEDERIN